MDPALSTRCPIFDSYRLGPLELVYVRPHDCDNDWPNSRDYGQPGDRVQTRDLGSQRYKVGDILIERV